MRMSVPSPAELRKQLTDVIGKSVLLAMGLKESLSEEKSALESQDLRALDNAVTTKSHCVNELAALDSKRAGLCTRAGFEAGPDQMQAVMQCCDEESVIANAWAELMAVAADCSALNMTNGAIIRLRDQHIRSSLSILRGQAPANDTYGHPNRESSGFEQRSLAEA